jgi:ferredoxin-NADP reductase/ferredoxin
VTRISYQQQSFELSAGQSVLDCLSGQGVPVPYSCRAGLCQTCLMRATEGTPPADSQLGLKDSLKRANYFLACVCQPDEDLAVALPDDAQSSIPAIVRHLERLSHDILRVDLESSQPIYYRAGQFIQLVHQHIHVRSYSIASVPRLDTHIQLHVRRLPEGRVSAWIHEELQIGQSVEIRGPAGDCVYVPGKPEQGLLLVGTGSGLAPLYGTLRDALDRGHSGPIRLFHGSRDEGGLYLIDELRGMERRYANFRYVPCLSGSDIPEGFTAGRVHEVALRETPTLKGWRVFLCGHPEMVKTLHKKAFLAGAGLQEIHADAFSHSHP